MHKPRGRKLRTLSARDLIRAKSMARGQVSIREGSYWTDDSWIPEKMERKPSRGHTSSIRRISDGNVEMA